MKINFSNWKSTLTKHTQLQKFAIQQYLGLENKVYFIFIFIFFFIYKSKMKYFYKFLNSYLICMDVPRKKLLIVTLGQYT